MISKTVLVTILGCALLSPGAAVAAGIQNGDFEKAGPTGAAEPSADGWHDTNAGAAGDLPEAEGGGAGGSAGRMRIGDNPKTPAPKKGPKQTGVGQEFDCLDKKDEEKFCNITFQSAYTAAPNETAYVAVSTPAGMVVKKIPAAAVFGAHGLAVKGCYPQSKIAFGIASAGADSASTLYIDKVACSCDANKGRDDLENVDAERQRELAALAGRVLRQLGGRAGSPQARPKGR